MGWIAKVSKLRDWILCKIGEHKTYFMLEALEEAGLNYGELTNSLIKQRAINNKEQADQLIDIMSKLRCRRCKFIFPNRKDNEIMLNKIKELADKQGISINLLNKDEIIV